MRLGARFAGIDSVSAAAKFLSVSAFAVHQRTFYAAKITMKTTPASTRGRLLGLGEKINHLFQIVVGAHPILLFLILISISKNRAEVGALEFVSELTLRNLLK
jgi:hypothetical protein